MYNLSYLKNTVVLLLLAELQQKKTLTKECSEVTCLVHAALLNFCAYLHKVYNACKRHTRTHTHAWACFIVIARDLTPHGPVHMAAWSRGTKVCLGPRVCVCACTCTCVCTLVMPPTTKKEKTPCCQSPVAPDGSITHVHTPTFRKTEGALGESVCFIWLMSIFFPLHTKLQQLDRFPAWLLTSSFRQTYVAARLFTVANGRRLPTRTDLSILWENSLFT